MITADRRYDIDWLRVIAIGLLIIYHIGIAFQPWGVFIGFIQSNKPLESLWIPMSILNIWRIPLLFFVSGMGVGFAIRKRNIRQPLAERTKRILLPLIFGIMFIVPVHIFIWQKYYNQDPGYSPAFGHLWFLGNIFVYVIFLSPLFFYLKRNSNGKVATGLKNLFSNPLGLMLIVVFFILEAILIRPEIYVTYAFTWHGFVLGLLAFLFGFIGIFTGSSFWQNLDRFKYLSLMVAVSLFIIRVLIFDLNSPRYFMAIESCTWIFAIFAFARKYLNHPGKTLRYLSQAAYPVYILHMVFLYLGSYLFFRLDISTWLMFIALVVFTTVCCFAFYELIRRISFIRPFFGLTNPRVPRP